MAAINSQGVKTRKFLELNELHHFSHKSDSTMVYISGKYLMMDSAKLFQTGRSQAVRLPKAYRFEGHQVFVKRVGQAVVLMPEVNSWDMMFEACDEFSKDFMEERNQPKTQERPALGE
jgi:antitoxin VapB